MILDASAIIAILRAEKEAPEIVECMARAAERRTSAVTYVEAAIVIDSERDPIASRRFDDFFRETRIKIEPVTVEQAYLARETYRDFGKGRHKAGLNLGDCFAYALAKEKGEPLLFKGDDFCHTDIESAANLK
jgi:ribonuclease VapC